MGKECGQATEREIHLLLNMERCSVCFIRKANNIELHYFTCQIVKDQKIGKYNLIQGLGK